MLPRCPLLPDRAAPRAIALAVGAWAALGAQAAAAAQCRIVLDAVLGEGWALAVRELERGRAAPEDCAHVDIEASGPRARLVFLTRDGRRAERVLEQPDELLPALLALGVGAPSHDPPSHAAASDIEQGLPPVASAPSGMDAAAVASGEPEPSLGAHAVFSLLGGTRGGVGHLLSPALGGSAAIELDRWELGVNLVLEVQYFDVGGGEPKAPSSAASVGVTVGRREPLGAVDVLFGARTMVAALNDESELDSGERGRAELRLGAYLGFAWPRDGGLRLRADLASDMVPHPVLGSAGTRITPWLAASALVGVEFDGP